MKGGWVYFMSNRRNGTLYVGVTANLSARVFQHREGRIEGFTARYGLKRLVYDERSRTFAMPSSARRPSSTGPAPGRCASSTP
jgi:predicted GIY-YIG superfamily endonuclease